MPEHRMFQVDAFTDRLFRGNPAAVMPLEGWLPEATLQAIAEENRLSETAFFVRTPMGPHDYHLRWFTPKAEVDLCGHATLASAHILWERLGFARDEMSFESRSGRLGAARLHGADAGLIELDFPAKPAERVEASDAPEGLVAALGGAHPTELLRGMDLLCVFEQERDVLNMTPDFRALARACDTRAVIVTAPGRSHDFVSRVFAPSVGIDEDPVTGSAHCVLAPYWADRLGKTRLNARQASARGGDLRCVIEGARVKIAGRAVTFFEARVTLP